MTAPSELTALAAAVIGTVLGTGLLLILFALPRWAAPGLERRIAPHIRDIADPLGLTALQAPQPGHRTRRFLLRAGASLGGSDGVARRLRQAGRTSDAAAVAAFRGRQLVWAAAGLVVGAASCVLLAVLGRLTPAAAVLPIAGALVGVLGCDGLLTRSARARTARIEEELPTVLEFLALCLSAGESVLDALRRVAQAGSGELASRLAESVREVGAGTALPQALHELARGLQIPALTRAVDHIVAALDRGAPLAQVLEAQASDARENAKRALIERAGRSEILMLVPVVFLILPLSVLFAVFPGILLLRLGFG